MKKKIPETPRYFNGGYEILIMVVVVVIFINHQFHPRSSNCHHHTELQTQYHYLRTAAKKM